MALFLKNKFHNFHEKEKKKKKKKCTTHTMGRIFEEEKDKILTCLLKLVELFTKEILKYHPL